MNRRIKRKGLIQYACIMVLLFMLSSCFPYLYKDRSKVIIDCVNVDETLKIAEMESKKESTWGCLGLWVIRDQYFNVRQAKEAARIYLSRIDSMPSGFAKWHFSWGIANIYRLGGDSIKQVTEHAYEYALKQSEKCGWFKGACEEHVNGKEVIMGDAHGGGRAYAKAHLVAPCLEDYVKSFEDYKKSESKN